MKFYKLECSHIFSSWGDYGNILVSGDANHRDGLREGPLQLYRTGPFIPPITFPGIGDIIVADDLKKNLEKSGLIGFTFRKVIKKHIVHLEWQKL